ncbi:MAG TPA: hypothetical protein VHY37_13745 [Tepidisphaeraceae bacterium]|nr:hypothetical protein [Tepidisphaeraceae bacterium]
MEQRTLLSGAAVRPGIPDATFGNDGVVTGTAATVSGQSVAVQSDGKTLVAGTNTAAGGNEAFIVTRYNTDGSIDASFGAGGSVTLNVDGGNDELAGIALQSDGKIVLAGNDQIDSTSSASHILLARLNADGTLDSTFGTGGKVVATGLAPSETASAVQVGADGSIVVAGAGTNGQVGSYATSDILIDRFNADGSADTTFADNGELLTQAPGSTFSEARGLAIQSDGKIVISADGQSGIVGSQSSSTFVLRYNAAGALDSTFAANTQPIAKLTGDPGQVVVETNGTILLAGTIATKKSGSAFGLVALNADGSLDRKFGHRGVATTSFGTYRQTSPRETAGAVAQAYGIAVESDGDIIVSGTVQTIGEQAVLTAYRPNGKPLQKFGKKGKASVAATGVSGLPGIALSPSGSPVAAVSGTGTFYVERFTPPI